MLLHKEPKRLSETFLELGVRMIRGVALMWKRSIIGFRGFGTIA